MRIPSTFHRSRLLLLLGVCLVLGSPKDVRAQVRIEAEAYSGTPFGVGRVTLHSGGDFRIRQLPVPGGGRLAGIARKAIEQATAGNQAPVNLTTAEMGLAEKSGRIFYPVFEKRDRPVLQEFIAVPTQATVLFLFPGDAPLDLSVNSSLASAGRIVPVNDSASHARLLSTWWSFYSTAADGRSALAEYPPLVEEYLVDTLARRLNLTLPERRAETQSILQSELNLLAGNDSARLAAARQILTSNTPAAPATEALAEELPRPRPEILNPPVANVEPMAMHVPVECLYVRFGKFSNFLWLRHRMDEWGGELRNIVSERGLDYGLHDRLQKQIGLREDALAELLGDQVIADVALVGLDTFMGEGAAMGTLFQAKSNLLLSANLTQQRNAALSQGTDGKRETVQIGGKAVSFYFTPDNAMRSFYVADGDFHLVTNSRTLVEWFLEVGAGNHPSLGASDAFKLARTQLPLDRNDSVFAYLSPEMFQNLLSAPYQIELNRRLHAQVEMELVAIARLAAHGEGYPANTVAELLEAGFLPPGFGQRSDGSRLEPNGSEGFNDTLRGRRGNFLPVPDVSIDRVTVAEREEYLNLADSYKSQWGPFDPVMAAINRQTLGDGKLERVTLELRAAPLSKQHSTFLNQWLGPPSDVRLTPVPGNEVSFEAVLRGGTFFSGADHHLFGGLRDVDPRIVFDPRPGLISRVVASALPGINGYLGAWPNPGWLRLLAGPLEGRADPAGYTRLITGAWRRQFNQFTLLSFHRDVLAQVSPQVRFVNAERPSQIWIHSEDLAKSKLAPLVNAFGYRQSLQIAQGNARFLNLLCEQLHVPPQQAQAAAERILMAKMVSPLGGGYELRSDGDGTETWVASAVVANPSGRPPADYRFAALSWLRGVDLDAQFVEGMLSAHGEFIMPVETKPTTGFSFPTLGVGGNKAPEKAVTPPAPTITPGRPTPPPPPRPNQQRGRQ